MSWGSQLPRLRALTVGFALAASLPAAVADAHWNTVGGGPLNASGVQPLPDPPGPETAIQNVRDVEVATIAGKVHAAWTEWDGTNFEARVARLDGTTWTQLGAPAASPINRDGTRNALDIDIAELNGEAVIAWSEVDANDIRQLRVARFDTATGDWVELLGGAQVSRPLAYPGPQDPDPFWGNRFGNSYSSGLGVAGGTPFVGSAWGTPLGSSLHVYAPDGAGTAWSQVLPPFSGTNDPRDVRLASDGETLALWFGTTFGTPSLLRRAPDGTWSRPSYGGDPGTDVRDAAVTVAGGAVWVAVVQDPDDSEAPGALKVTRLPAGATVGEQVGSVDPRAGRPGSVSDLKVASSGVFLSWFDTTDDAAPKLRVAWYRPATDWTELGEPLNGPAPQTPPPTNLPPLTRADLTALDGSPYAGWAEWNGTQYVVRVSRYGDDPAPAPQPPAPDAQPVDVVRSSGDDQGGEQPAGQTATGDQPGTVGGASSTGTGGGTGASAPAPSGSSAVKAASLSRITIDPHVFRVLTTNVKPSANGRTIRLRLRCVAAKGCAGTVVARSRGKNGKTVSLARGTVKLKHGATGTVVLRTTGEGRRLLRRGASPFALVLSAR
ncbi:MAG TPA: hypothetical protein VN238_07365 [Solirubrobacteraceae bacterium]|nr:hypothetical protein [Solirubrobacteraceae bacterium]